MVELRNPEGLTLFGQPTATPPTEGTDSWSFSHYEALAHRCNRTISVPKAAVPNLPPRYTEVGISTHLLDGDAIRAYRDNRPRQSVHVIEYSERWDLHVDAIHPGHDALGHLRADAPFLYGLGLIGAAHLLTNDRQQTAGSDSGPIFG